MALPLLSRTAFPLPKVLSNFISIPTPSGRFHRTPVGTFWDVLSSARNVSQATPSEVATACGQVSGHLCWAPMSEWQSIWGIVARLCVILATLGAMRPSEPKTCDGRGPLTPTRINFAPGTGDHCTYRSTKPTSREYCQHATLPGNFACFLAV